MKPSDQEVIETLLRASEMLYVQTLLLRVILQESKVEGWRDRMDILANSDAANFVRAEFQRTYAQAVRTRQALDQFLVNLPTSDSIQ